MWGIYLYLVEWRTCAVIRLQDRHALTPRLRIIRSHWDGSPIMQPWYYLQRWISAGAKFHPSLHLKLSYRGGCGELAQDPCTQAALWKRLLTHQITFRNDCRLFGGALLSMKFHCDKWMYYLRSGMNTWIRDKQNVGHSLCLPDPCLMHTYFPICFEIS